MIKAEWRYLKQHKLLMIVLFVIMLIPSIYAVTFLKSMWDPYGKLSDLPVAVVNHDHAVDYQGQHLAAGQTLATNLRHSQGMDFKIVGAQSAAQGLKAGKYYMIVTIPQNFSHNATTLMTKRPSKMVLHYETSAGHNFTAAKMTESAAKAAAQSVGEQVTKSYAQTMFTSIKKLGTGLTTAAKGNYQLAQGSRQLTVADQKVAGGLKTLAASSVKLTNGEQTLTEHLKTYVTGVNQAQAGSQQLTTGLDQLLQKSQQLIVGSQRLATGSQRVSKGVDAYTQGADHVNVAAGQLASGSQTVSTGAQRYVAGVTNANAGARTLSQQLVTLNQKTTQLNTNLNQVADHSQSLSSGVGQLTTGSAALAAGLKKVQTTFGGSATQQAALKQAVSRLAESTTTQAAVKQDAKKLETALTTMTNAKTTAESSLHSQLAATADKAGLTASQKAAMLKTADTASSQNDQSLNAVQRAAQQLSQDLSELPDSTNVAALSTQLTTAASKQNELATAIDTLTINADTLSQHLATANSGLSALNTGLQTLASKSTQLTSGVSQLADGAGTLAAGTQALHTKGNSLTAGTTKLASGSSQLATGTQQLTAKNQQLTSGAAQVTAGLTTLAQQTPALKQGVTKLDTGATKLTSGLTTLATNGPRLTSGMQTILAGNQQATAGTRKLATGAESVTTGTAKVQTGNQKLATSLKKAGDRATVHPSQLTYRQFAKPTTTSHTERDDAPNNGTGMAPYMVSVSLFVGALAFNMMFDMYTPRKYPRSGVAWWTGKASIMGAFVLGEAILIISLLELIDGLAPVHAWATFVMILCTGAAFMAIVYWLNLVLGRPGAFFAMILMVLQLGGSAGTYPIQLSNGFFNAIHPWLPMTYSVNGLRETLMIGNTALPEMGILLGVTVAFSGLAVLFYARRHGRISAMDFTDKVPGTQTKS